MKPFFYALVLTAVTVDGLSANFASNHPASIVEGNSDAGRMRASGNTSADNKTEQPKSDRFDFSHWKLTLPVDQANTYDGHPVEISTTKLAAGYRDPYFGADSKGDLVFWCPVIGAATEGTDYARSELREMQEPGNPRKNWMAKGSHVLTARCRILQVPSNPKVVIGQIHSASGKKKPLIKLQFFKGRIEALVKSSPTKGKDIKLTWPDIGLNSDVDYEIKVQDEILSVTVNGITQAENIKDNDSQWMKQTFYFKAGMYPQDNKGNETEGGRISFSKLKVSHQHIGG